MTITTRSKRVSLFCGAAPTPSSVGPGAYAPEKLGTSFKTEPRILSSGFAASDKRDLNANKTTSAITPGPGAYADDHTGYYTSPSGSSSTNTAQSNVFATKISRFAPSAPGSSVFRASSIQDNPGPGAYNSAESYVAMSQHDESCRSGAPRSGVVVAARPSVPTIPRKEQSYGYTKDPLNGELTLQAQPTTTYSGLGQDTVGPAAYNSHSTIWNDRKNVAPSIRSTVKREVWEEYNTPRRQVPGPGQYDPVSNLRGTSSSNKKASAVFASRVPILPAPKRADQYDPEKDLELLAKEQRGQQNTGNKSKNKFEAFGSTTGRADLAVQLSAPFSSPSFTATPGPGKYVSSSTSNFSGFNNGSMRQASHRARGATYRENQHIGFTSATQRHCLSEKKPSTSPGPGQYKSETPRTVEKAVKAKQTIGRFGVFGSTSERHVWDKLETMEPEDVTPGPGAYENATETHGGHFPKLVSSAAFKSSSSRFARRANPHASPHVHCVGELGYSGAEASARGEAAEQLLHSPRTTTISPTGAPFLSTAERSVFDAKETKYVPGPGQYEYQSSSITTTADQLDASGGGLGGGSGANKTRSRGVRATLGNEQRFKVRPCVPAHVGPGAYAIPGTVGTKSFNVTMAAAAPSKR